MQYPPKMVPGLWGITMIQHERMWIRSSVTHIGVLQLSHCLSKSHLPSPKGGPMGPLYWAVCGFWFAESFRFSLELSDRNVVIGWICFWCGVREWAIQNTINSQELCSARCGQGIEMLLRNLNTLVNSSRDYASVHTVGINLKNNVHLDEQILIYSKSTLLVYKHIRYCS